MKKVIVLVAAAVTLSACTPVKAVTSTAIGAGQVALGTAQIIL